MAIVTGLTAERMAEIEAASIVDAELVGDDLVLTKHDGTPINVGGVKGPPGPDTEAAIAPVSAKVEVIKESPLNLLLPEFGITGAGAGVNDRVALQARFNALQDGYEYNLPRAPGGHYRIEGAPLDIPAPVRNIKIGGLGEIRQYTNNIPVIRSNGQFQRERHYHDLTLAYNTEQPAGNSGATALEFVSDIAYSSFYWSSVKRIKFRNHRKGIGTNTPGIDFTCWNCAFEELTFEKTSYQLIDLVPQGNGGIPVNTFKQIRGLNNLAAAPGAVGPALNMHGEFTMDGLDLEDWHGIAMVAGSGAGTVRGIHIERHRLDTAFGSLFYLSGGHYTFDVVNLGDLVSTINSSHSVFTLSSYADLEQQGVELVSGPVKDINGSNVGLGTIAMLQGDLTSRATLRTPKLGPHAVMPLVYPGLDAEKIVRSVDEGPAPWNGYYQLPAASAAYRGRRFYVQSGDTVVGGHYHGQADSIKTCVMNANGTYSWV